MSSRSCRSSARRWSAPSAIGAVPASVRRCSWSAGQVVGTSRRRGCCTSRGTSSCGGRGPGATSRPLPAYHLLALEGAIASPHLALRLRTVLVDSRAVLAEPAVLHDLAGHDRRMAQRGCVVLPSTIAAVDPLTLEVVLVEQTIDDRIPCGRMPISAILLRDRDAGLDVAARHLALARTVLLHEVVPLEKAIGQVDELVGRHHERIQLAAANDIAATVRQLGGRAAR